MTENLGPAETPYEKKKLDFEPHASFIETTTSKFQKLPKFGCQEHCFSTCLRLVLSVEERLSYIFFSVYIGYTLFNLQIKISNVHKNP